MENILDTHQPRGIRGFGWGLLGFIGSNFIINIIATLGTVVIVLPAIGASNGVAGLLAFPIFAAAIWAALVFQRTRNYEATKTGIGVSIGLNIVVFVLAFIGEMT